MRAHCQRQLLYRTKTVCHKCVLLERKQVALVDAQVLSVDHKVVLSAMCPSHGAHETLYCSDLYFFNRMSTGWSMLPPPRGDDMEVRSITPHTLLGLLRPLDYVALHLILSRV